MLASCHPAPEALRPRQRSQAAPQAAQAPSKLGRLFVPNAVHGRAAWFESIAGPATQVQVHAMPAALIWVVAHPNPYAYPTLAACQHAMHVFALPSQAWACRLIDVLPSAATSAPMPSKAIQDRRRRNEAYDEARLLALIAAHVQWPR